MIIQGQARAWRSPFEMVDNNRLHFDIFWITVRFRRNSVSVRLTKQSKNGFLTLIKQGFSGKLFQTFRWEHQRVWSTRSTRGAFDLHAKLAIPLRNCLLNRLCSLWCWLSHWVSMTRICSTHPEHTELIQSRILPALHQWVTGSDTDLPLFTRNITHIKISWVV